VSAKPCAGGFDLLDERLIEAVSRRGARAVPGPEVVEAQSSKTCVGGPPREPGEDQVLSKRRKAGGAP
jgi:hypothetical protein